MEINKKAKSLLIINTIFFIVVLCIPILSNSKQLFNTSNLFLIGVVGISLLISGVSYFRLRRNNKAEEKENEAEKETKEQVFVEYDPLTVEEVKLDPIVAMRNKLNQQNTGQASNRAIGKKEEGGISDLPADFNILDDFEEFRKRTEEDFEKLTDQKQSHDHNEEEFDEITTRSFPIDYDDLSFDDN